MKKLTFSVAAFVTVAALISGCGLTSISKDTIFGSGKVTTEKREVKDFSNITLSGSADVNIEVGPKTSVVVVTDDNIQAAVETSVDRGTLRIGTLKPYWTRSGVRVNVTVEEVRKVNISGSGSVFLNGLRGGDLDFDISGSGNAVLQGRADDFNVRVSGSGKVDASKLAAEEVKANVSGSGDIAVNAVEAIDATVSGSGSVQYYGRPARVEQHVSGSGSVKSK